MVSSLSCNLVDNLEAGSVVLENDIIIQDNISSTTTILYYEVIIMPWASMPSDWHEGRTLETTGIPLCQAHHQCNDSSLTRNVKRVLSFLPKFKREHARQKEQNCKHNDGDASTNVRNKTFIWCPSSPVSSCFYSFSWRSSIFREEETLCIFAEEVCGLSLAARFVISCSF